MRQPLLPAAVALLISLGACGGASPAATVATETTADPVLAVEDPQADLQALPAAAAALAIEDAVRPVEGFSVPVPAPTVLARLRQAVARAAPDKDAFAPDGGGFDPSARGAAERLAALLRTGPAPDAAARLAARPDRAAVGRLASLLGRPDRVGERQLAAFRVRWALDAATQTGPAALAATDRQTVAAGVDRVLAGSRQSPEEWQGRLTPLREVVDAERQRLPAIVAGLTPADVQALLAVYDSPAGRARRDALTAAFRTGADRTMRAVLIDFLVGAGATP